MIEEVAKRIYRIPISLPDNPLRTLNSYLIYDRTRSLLIDAGFRHEQCKRDLFAGFAELGVNPEDMDIFLTHMHADHSGLAPEAAGEGSRIFISDIDLSWLLNAESVKNNWDRLTSGYIMAGMPDHIIENMAEINPAIKMAATPGCGKYSTLSDGDTLSAGGYTFRCVLTPGHTPGHLCLWSEENGLMFTGDHILFDITPNITAWPASPDTLGDYLNSLTAVYEFPVKTALPGHRKSGDFHIRIKELIEHHERRLAEIVSIISETPGINAYDIAGKMKWQIRAADWNVFPDAQKIFAVGECMSHLDYLLLRKKISRGNTTHICRYYVISH